MPSAHPHPRSLLPILLILAIPVPTIAAEFREHTIERHDESTQKYHCLVSLPDGYDQSPNRKWPLILFLHGGGMPQAPQLKQSIGPLCDLPAVVVAPLCPPSPDGPRNTKWEWKPLGQVVREISRLYRVDERRCSVLGFSMGGSGAWELPSYEPKLFSKCVVMAGVCHPWSLRHYPKIPVWVFSGDKDYMRKEQHETVTSAQRFKVDVVESVWAGTDHGGIFRNTMAYARMRDWLVSDEDLRSEQLPQQQDSSTNTRLRNLREHFGEQQFAPPGGFVLRQGQRLPDLVWASPELIGQVLDTTTIPTQWFNESFQPVQTADVTGRYYAYGTAPTPAGPPLRRAMTCCCIESDVDLNDLTSLWIARAGGYAESPTERAAAIIRRWTTTESGAIELAAWREGGFGALPLRTGQWQMENASRHVQLKRMLLGLSDRPPVIPEAQLIDGEPAPTLRIGSLAEAGITTAQVEGLRETLKRWYADSQEPMAVVLARNGVIVLAEAYGSVGHEPATIQTPMRLDSAMKPLIGVQLATYVEHGGIKLDEPIGRYLSDFDTKQDHTLTFRAAHVHATGIQFPWSLAFRRLFYFHTWHDALIAHCPREWQPGERHRYGVVGVILSVRAIELLRGLNYWDAMERDLLQPLGIEHVLPGGWGFSAEGLAKIGVLMANEGRYGNREFFSSETCRAIQPTSLQPYFPQLQMRYGIGFQNVSQHLGPGSYGHGGGCGTLLAINPDQHVVFAMVRNAPGKNYQQHRKLLLSQIREWIEASR